jgi:hypothetical protein
MMLGIMTHGIMTLGIKALIIMGCKMALDIMILSVKTLGI